MTPRDRERWRPPRLLLMSWAALLALLALTVFSAYQPLGTFNTVVAMTIALVKALIVLAIFMELRRHSALTVAFASAGFFWLAIMLWLALGDYVTRPNFPPHSLGL
jgi:cytochrome c oxidase subunit 4